MVASELPMIMRLTRDDGHFDLGLQVGNIDAYCNALLHLIFEGLAMERRMQSVDPRMTYAYNHISQYEHMLPHFAYVVGKHFDVERIHDDLMYLYAHLSMALDAYFPNWDNQCPTLFKFQLTPGYFVFTVDA